MDGQALSLGELLQGPAIDQRLGQLSLCQREPIEIAQQILQRRNAQRRIADQQHGGTALAIGAAVYGQGRHHDLQLLSGQPCEAAGPPVVQRLAQPRGNTVPHGFLQPALVCGIGGLQALVGRAIHQLALLHQAQGPAAGMHHGRTLVQKNHAYRQILQYGQRCIQQCLGTVQASVNCKCALQMRHELLHKAQLFGAVGTHGMRPDNGDVERSVMLIVDHGRAGIEQVLRPQPVAIPLGTRQAAVGKQGGGIHHRARSMQTLVLQPDIALTVVGGKAFEFGGGKALAGAESAEAPVQIHRPLREVVGPDHAGR